MSWLRVLEVLTGALTVPNVLTCSRLLALPAVVLLFRQDHFVAASLLFLAAMLTDVIDGWLAGILNQRSRLGLYLDSVVDKILILALFYELAYAGMMSWTIPHLFLVRELLHNGVRCAAAAGGTIVGANWMGKVKACLQTAVIVAGLALPALECPVAGMLALRVSAAVVLAVAWMFFFVFAHRNRRVMGF